MMEDNVENDRAIREWMNKNQNDPSFALWGRMSAHAARLQQLLQQQTQPLPNKEEDEEEPAWNKSPTALITRPDNNSHNETSEPKSETVATPMSDHSTTVTTTIAQSQQQPSLKISPPQPLNDSMNEDDDDDDDDYVKVGSTPPTTNNTTQQHSRRSQHHKTLSESSDMSVPFHASNYGTNTEASEEDSDVQSESSSNHNNSSSTQQQVVKNKHNPYSYVIPNYSDSTFEVTRSGRHMKLLLDNVTLILDNKKLMSEQTQAQNNKCAQCDKVLSKDYGIFRKPRVCCYTNKIYCMDCHKNEMSVIPSRIIHQWDFKQYPVCVTAKAYLDEILSYPIICISAHNPLAFDKVSNLRKARMIRKRLMLQWEILEDCTRNQSLMQKWSMHKHMYLVTDTEVYSLQNLMDLNCSAEQSPFLKQLAQLFHAFSQHITQQCQYCKNKAKHTCEKCFDPEPIYLFNLTSTIQCPQCKKMFHTNCFRNEKNVKACPYCS
jgi:hypothetical protein